MIIRNWQSEDAVHEERIYNVAAAQLPGFVPISVEDIHRSVSGPTFNPANRFYAQDDGQVVAFAAFETDGHVHYPWCLPGQR